MTLYASAAFLASALRSPDEGTFAISAARMSAEISLEVLLLMDSPSLVGCGVEIASYREGASAHTASHGSALASGEGHNHAHRTGRHRLALLPLQRSYVGLSPRPYEGKAPPTGPDHLDDVSVGIPQ